MTWHCCQVEVKAGVCERRISICRLAWAQNDEKGVWRKGYLADSDCTKY